VCTIIKGQRFSRKLNEKQVTAILKATCERPKQREESILKVFVQMICGTTADIYELKLLGVLASF
jgi:hypothetical protein